MTKHRTNILLLVAALLTLLPLAAGAQDVSAKKNRRSRLEKEIAELDRQIKANASKSSDANYNLTLVRKKISSRKELIEESDREIAQLDDQIRATQRGIDSLQLSLDDMTRYFNKLVKTAYKNRDSRVWYMYILASENFSQGFKRLAYLKSLSKEMNSQAARIRTAKSEVEAKRASLVGMKSDAQQLRSNRMGEVSKLQQEEAASQNLIASLKKDKNKYQNQLAAKRKEVEALNREIARLVAEAVNGETKSSKKAGSSSTKAKKPVDVKLSNEFSANKGKLPWPADGPVVETFGVHYHPVYTQLKLPDSDGISIAVAPGTEAKAVFNGEVKKVIVMQGYNKCVLVQHGSYFTFYCKLGSVAVKAGDKVKTGQVLGTVDSIGDATQLHFQLWSSKGPQNPVPWLR